MAIDLQDAILKAVETLTDSRIDKLQLDKTITATVVQCTNSLTGEYKLSYNGGFIYGYAPEGTSYTQNQSVYVLVPEGDFTKKKIIVGKSQALEDDQNISFVASALSDYNLLGKNAISDPKSILPVEMCSYLKENYELLYQYDPEGSYTADFLAIDAQELENGLKEAEALLIEASFQTRLPKEHRLSKTGVYGLQFVLAFADRDNVDEEGNATVKYLSYTIDNNNMTGNPYLFTSWSDQYAIYPIDTENFLYIDSILAFGHDFVEQDDRVNAELWGEDIFIKDLEIYGLKQITAVSGDYKLSLSMPQGSTFKSILADDFLQVVGKVTQLSTILSDGTMFYWFAEDNRVTAASEDYQMYGGSGWRYLKDKGNNYTFTTLGNENKAYENRYLCVAVYKENIILKEYFTLYNEAAKRDLSISSSLGIKFSFDRGTPTLTCLINGKSEGFELGEPNAHQDNWFRFIWSKVDSYGQTIIFNQTKEELQAAYDQGIADGIGYAALSALRAEILAMEGVEFTPGKNTLTYPVKGIDGNATFKCSVYLRDTELGDEYYIGTAEIVLQNEDASTPYDYYIIIENGDQVFQYSESGVSPDDERYTDPLEIKPLTCHFYDPAGLEVNKNTYEIKWRVPLESTMIVTPKEGMEFNPATEKIEWCISENYPVDIASDYDYQALNNQVQAIVTYQGQEYTEYTQFLFTKIGENGTNGTDMVAKISPTSDDNILDSELLTLELKDGQPEQWNTGQAYGSQVLKFNLYQRNESLNILDKDVAWSISGGISGSTRSKYMSVDDGRVYWKDTADSDKAMFRNQIVKASTRLDGFDYYAFYPVPVIDYKGDIGYKVKIDSVHTLKSITYNADGRNPLYNKNQGIFINLDTPGKYIVWQAEGGEPRRTGTTYYDNPTNACFKLTYEKNSSDGRTILTPLDTDDGSWEDLTNFYILPDDVYDGEYCNNLIHGKIYSSKKVYQNNGNPEVEIYIPIYMSLNTYGLKSLNAWDGNHVEINEDENYILAPQIGAGEKDSENKFTGVVMGTTKTYDADDSSVGLLGYSHGKQSIWLDAETGNAIFGLPEDQATNSNHYTEGRIELVPGGDSKIGMWTIGSRAMYNMTQPPEPIGTDEDGNIDFEDEYVKVDPDRPYTDYPVPDAQMSIPHKAQGILLNANPAYISVKGMPLDEDNSDIDWEGANTTIRKGDSLEVELDPRKSSVFSIYRHTTYDGAEDTGRWRRYPLVGINANGQFYTNAIEDGESSMGIGNIGAFRNSAADKKYVGAQFAWRGNNLFKFFVDIEEDESDEDKTLHISTGSKIGDRGDEYPRAVRIYGNGVTLLAPETGNLNSPSSSHSISITPSQALFGHLESSYISIPYDGAKTAEITLKNNLDIITAANRSTFISTGGFTLETIGNDTLPNDISLSSSKDMNINLVRDKNVKIGRYLYLDTQDFHINAHVAATVTESNWSENFDEPKKGSASSVTYNNVTQLAIGNDNAYINLRPASIKSRVHSDTGWNISSKTGGIFLKSYQSSEGIILQATPPNSTDANGARISLIPQQGGSSDFLLTSAHGSVQSKSNLGNGRAGVQITNGIGTIWGYFTGTPDKSNKNSITAKNNIQSTSGEIWGQNFLFNSSKSWSSHGGTYNSQSLEQHLTWIYNLINNAYNRADSAYNRADSAYNRADSAYNRANSAYNLAETKVSTSTYRNHKHYLQQDLFTFTRYDTPVGHVVDISQYGSGTHTVKLQQETGKPVKLPDKPV